MFQTLLTQNSTPVIGQVAQVLGFIMNALYNFLDNFGVVNIGLIIIVFTFLIKMLMLPLTVKQSKFQKLSARMNPELQAIQKKYKNKQNDQQAMLKMQSETKEVYEKYGTSPTGGCLQLIIQLPIIYALYRVVSNIPAYVDSVKLLYSQIVDPIMQTSGWESVMEKTFDVSGTLTQNTFIDRLVNFSAADWSSLAEAFPTVADVINSNVATINHMYSFFGIDLISSPGLALTPALLIPILAGVTQWISTKLMTKNQNQPAAGEGNAMAASMQTMNTVMPIMSAVFCISFPCYIGLYWIASTVFQILQTICVNKYMDSIDIDKLIEKNLEKANAKRAKKGLAPEKIARFVEPPVIDDSKLEEKKKQREEAIKKSTEYYKSNIAKPGSLAANAQMVQKYNEKTKK